MKPFAEIARSLGPRIDAALAGEILPGSGCPERLREAMRYSLLAPGKRLRPILVLLANEACGGTIDAALPAACAVEMVHAYSLIHDDLPAMDDDDLRRGRPTCHKVFGEGMAILAGDALLTLAFEVLARKIEPATVAVACCASLAEAAGRCNMVGGQADDIAETGRKNDEEAQSNPDHETVAVPKNGGKPPSCLNDIAHRPLIGHLSPRAARLEAIHSRKTGAMIRVSLRMGALVASATPGQLTTLDDYGQRIGLAFQITDDLLDVRSNEAAAGKRVGKDAIRGKLTFPGLLGLDQSAQHAEQLIAQAAHALTTFGARADGLESLADYVLRRDR
jgi:geranylgeranyl diphosphate synthase type II